MSTAYLVLSDGTTFKGKHFGSPGSAIGEVVFNTGMTGYQEILTDPSYAGQLVTLTFPLIGNYGINQDDFESIRIQSSSLIIHELCESPSSWRSSSSLEEFLASADVVGISGIDTRRLTRYLRARGVTMGIVSSQHEPDEMKRLLAAASAYDMVNYVEQVSTPQPFVWPSDTDKPKYQIALLDCGVKFNILRSLAALGAEITVWPAFTAAEEILATNPDGIFLSPGPGDPALLGEVVKNVRTLIHAKPTMGICLGNQLIGCAFGGHTFKLPFGHRGSNHPVKDLETGKVVITSQNHGYALATDFLDPSIAVWQINLNDGTVEGLKHRTLPIFSIQYHPEASPGPKDSIGYLAQFLRMIDETSG
jgi:carbamoyl-phosphate synthase small subunit